MPCRQTPDFAIFQLETILGHHYSATPLIAEAGTCILSSTYEILTQLCFSRNNFD